VAAGWTPEEVYADHPKPTLYRGRRAAPACSNTGYRGRKALLELLVVTEDVEHLIIEGGTADDIHKLAVQQGMVTLRQSGLRKALEGETTLEEVLRVVA
jgi:type IV pilus assembly protein PilB